MDIHQLKIFTTVYRLGSFTRASKELGISQPTISEHIKNLEASLSCRLFDRMGRSIRPTAQADLLFPRAQHLLDSVSTLQDDLAGSLDRISGRIVLGTSSVPGAYIVPAKAAEFKRRYPEVTFEVIIADTAAITGMIADHEIFCGIVGARQDSDRLEFIPFLRDELILVASPELTTSKRLAPKELAKIPFLLREEGSGTRKCMKEHLENAGIDVGSLDTVAVLGSNDAVKEAAKQGLGATILSKLAVESELATGALKRIDLKGVSMTRDFYLVHHMQRTLPIQYQTFCDHLQKRVSS